MKPWKQHSGFIPLGMFGDRGETRRMLTYHEEASKERMSHIQTVVNKIDETVTKNEKNLFVLKDRDNGKRR